MAEPRQKFTDAIRERLTAVMPGILKEFPELIGINVVLTYSPELRETAPHALSYVDTQSPGLMCEMGMQVSKLLQDISQSLAENFRNALAVRAELDQELHDKQAAVSTHSDAEASRASGRTPDADRASDPL